MGAAGIFTSAPALKAVVELLRVIETNLVVQLKVVAAQALVVAKTVGLSCAPVDPGVN